MLQLALRNSSYCMNSMCNNTAAAMLVTAHHTIDNSLAWLITSALTPKH